MVGFEGLETWIRYTTWYHYLETSTVPIYLTLVFTTFFLWNRLSARLYPSSGSVGTAARELDFFADASPRNSVLLDLPLINPNLVSGSPVFTSSTIVPRNKIVTWVMRLLASFMIWVLYQLHSPHILGRLAWIMRPVIHLTILLHILQYIQVANIGSSITVPTHRLARMVVKKCGPLIFGPLRATRALLNALTTPTTFYRLQIIVAIVGCGFVAHTFIQNEPLTRTIPPLSAPPRHMCPAGSPTKPFAQTWQDYVKFHAEMLLKPKDEQRLLIFHAGSEGLGNRLEGLISSFVLAVVTNRAWVVDWNAGAKCHARLPELFANPGFSWEVNWNTMHYREPDAARFNYPYCRACPIRTRREGEEYMWSSLLCEPDANFPKDKRIVALSSTQFFAPVIALNPHLRDKVCELFGSNMFETVAPYLLKLKPELEKRKNDWKAAKGWHNSSEVVSIHIRRLEGFGVPDTTCDSYLRCANAVSKTDNVKYFVATDHIETRERFQSILGDKMLHWESVFDRSSTAGIQDAIIEMFLLGEANNMIMTPYSTFSDVAHARTGLVPYKVNRGGQCTRLLTAQPCFFYYFGLFDLKCWDDSMIVSELTNQENCFV